MDNERRYPKDDPPDLLEGPEAEAELQRLGTSSGHLRHAVFRGYLARRDFSHPHFPPTTAGYVDWAVANKICRDIHVPMGWSFRNDTNVPKTVAPGSTHAITVLQGDDGTGLRHRIPSTRRGRGTQGARDVRSNAQTDLFDYRPAPPTEQTYYLLVNKVKLEDRSILRTELSLPWELSENGDVIRWFKRIILPVINVDDGPPEPRMDDVSPDRPTPEIDVRVERRA